MSLRGSNGAVLFGCERIYLGQCGPVGWGGIALDGQGNSWIVANQNGSTSVIEPDNNGNLLSLTSGFSDGAAATPDGLAIDRAGKRVDHEPGQNHGLPKIGSPWFCLA